MAQYPGFIGASDRSQSPIADVEQTMNWYVEVLPRSAKSPAALYPTPGQAAWTTVSQVGTRALFQENGRCFGVVATVPYEFTRDMTPTALGAVTQDSNPGTIVTNGATGAQAFFTSGTNGYLLNLLTNAFSQVLTGTATMGGMLDGYFLAFNKTTGKFAISNLNDGSTWDPTQFAQRSSAPDNWQSMVINAPDIWLIGEKTGDVWYDAGSFPFPFAPRPGVTFKYGTPATFSVIPVGQSVMWLSRTTDGAGIVVRALGYAPQRVSTAALETAIAQYERDATIADAEAMSYAEDGHTFYVLTFPTARKTWAYDLTTGLWAQRGKWNPRLNDFDIWTPRVHAYAFGKHLVGDRNSGQISTLDVTTGTEADGSAIRRIRVAPSLFRENRLIPQGTLEVFLEAGLGTSTGQGFAPLGMLRTSDDGGKTWGRERQGSLGAIGRYGVRLQFTRLGQSRDRVYEFSMSDPIPGRVIDAYINNGNPT